MVQLSELFYSMQGEGPAVGRPAIFIRLSKCNLCCKGCDSPIKDKVEETSPETIVNRVKNYLKTYPNSRIVFTGGEPFLQPTAINEVINGLPSQIFDVETNGTIMDQIELYKRFNLVIVSPKKNYFDSPKNSIQFFKDWAKISEEGRKNIYFKIVVGNLPWAWSESEVRDVLKFSGMASERVWLMPAGDTNDKLQIAGKNTWRVAMRLGCNFSDRLHIRNGGK